MSRILLIGGNGQIGRALQQKFLSLDEEHIVSNRDFLDLSRSDQIKLKILDLKPMIIINAAAYTYVDRAECESELAFLINANAPKLLAEITEEVGAQLIHFSTNYVFDGQKSNPYVESDCTNPLSIYGKSKLAGETEILNSGFTGAIIRTSWVYSTRSKQNFAKTMLNLGSEKESIRVVYDQIGGPTWANNIADAIIALIPHIQPHVIQLYHYTNSGVASWYDFAIAIFEEARELGLKLAVKEVIPVKTADYPTAAERPAYSVLSGEKIAQRLGQIAPHWRDSLRKMLQEFVDKR